MEHMLAAPTHLSPVPDDAARHHREVAALFRSRWCFALPLRPPSRDDYRRRRLPAGYEDALARSLARARYLLSDEP